MRPFRLFWLIVTLCACTPAAPTIRSDPAAASEPARAARADAEPHARQFHVRTIEAAGVSLAYVDEGAGTPVILIHGSGADYRGWSSQVSLLAPHYRVIAYSRRYHPPNPMPSAGADAGVERQVEDLAALLDALQVQAAHLVGHSYGGTVAAAFALRHPDRVRSLVLADPGLGTLMAQTPHGNAQAAEAQAVRADLAEAFAAGDAERIVRTYAARVAPGRFDRLDAAVRSMLLENARAFELDLTAPRPRVACADLGRIAVPVLVLAGERSPEGLQRIAETSAACIPAARLVTLREATHWMQYDQPEEFNAAVLDFLVEAETSRRQGRR